MPIRSVQKNKYPNRVKQYQTDLRESTRVQNEIALRSDQQVSFYTITGFILNNWMQLLYTILIFVTFTPLVNSTDF